MARNELLSRSFMLMNFAAAAFLIATQWQPEPDLAAERVVTTTVVASMEQAAYMPQPTASVSESPVAPSAAALAAPPSSPNAPAYSLASASTPAIPQPQVKDGLSSTLPDFLIPNLPRLVVDLSDRQVYLYKGEQLHATYPVGIGQSGWETPIGSFRINHMQPDPIWQHPITGQTIAAGPDNPLGSRWIGFWISNNYEIGFHGTNQPSTVGQAVSHGCLRMREADVKVLYEQVKLGTSVVVRQ